MGKNLLNYFKKAKKNNVENVSKTTLYGNCAGRKICTSNGATLTINNNYHAEKTANEDKIEKILKKYLKTPEELFKYINGAGTKVIKSKLASKILSVLGEDEGFILPKTGIKAFIINLIFNKKISSKTSDMFIVSSFKINEYAMTYQFYNWYCYKMKLSGFEDETQEKFKNIFELKEDDIKELSFEEILELKGAIKRDLEAIDFVRKFVQKQSISKKNLEKIKLGKAVKV